MNSLIQQIRTRSGIDPVIVGIFSAALLLYGIAWWLRESSVRFNINVFLIAGGILMVNIALTSLTVRREITIAYLLAGATLLTHLLLLILVWKASQGALL